jgi:hypothetical protein
MMMISRPQIRFLVLCKITKCDNLKFMVKVRSNLFVSDYSFTMSRGVSGGMGDAAPVWQKYSIIIIVMILLQVMVWIITGIIVDGRAGRMGVQLRLESGCGWGWKVKNVPHIESVSHP